jgi:Domain of unknown function (DUF4173)
MSRGTKVAIVLAGLALALGVLGDLLFRGQLLGLNVALWTLAFVLVLTVLLRVARAPLHQGRRFMVAPLLLFAALFVWHDSPLLVAANLLALAAAVSMGALRRPRPRLRATTLSDYGGGLIAAGSSLLVGAVALLMRDIRWNEVAGRARSEKVAAVARGLMIGTPLLLLFGGLFVAADVMFKQLLSSAVPSLGSSTVAHFAIVLAWAWAAGGLLRDLLAPREERRPLPARVGHPLRLGAVEVNVALAALNLLFLAFVLVQFRYLFGGRSLVEGQAHLTYAEYARQGFFELVVVAALTIAVLLAGDWLLRDEGGRRVFRWLAIALLALLAVVMVSALQRMRLYMQEYGLTELRLYATGTIVWLAVVCAWFVATVLRGRRHAFALGALVAGFAATLCLNVLNPDALIARTNVTRPVVDVVYLAGLSDDAVPTLVGRISSLQPGQQRLLAEALLQRDLATADWRSWNVSRARAQQLLREHRPELLAIAGG